MKMELRRRPKATRDAVEGECSSHRLAQLGEAEELTSASSGDRLRGKERSKRREDLAHAQRKREEEGGKGKAIGVDMGLGEISIRHRCAFESICALTKEFVEIQKDAIRGTVWAPVLQYKAFAMDRHMVQALIEAWNPDAKAFRIGHREVRFSYFDVALLTGLPSTGRPVVFERGEGAGEAEQLLMAAMEDRLERERQRRRIVHTDVRIYRNYVP